MYGTCQQDVVGRPAALLLMVQLPWHACTAACLLALTRCLLLSFTLLPPPCRHWQC